MVIGLAQNLWIILVGSEIGLFDLTVHIRIRGVGVKALFIVNCFAGDAFVKIEPAAKAKDRVKVRPAVDAPGSVSSLTKQLRSVS